MTGFKGNMGLFSKKKPRIFVQIAAYRDPETQWTVKDLFEKAMHPERVSVGICWQFDKEADTHCFEVPYPRPKQVRVKKFHYEDSLGAGWARSTAQSLCRDEEYTLMLDGHMRFVEGWDEKLIHMLERCATKPAVLSTSLPDYKLPNDLQNVEGKLTYTHIHHLGDENDPQLIHAHGGVCDASEHSDGPFPGAYIIGNFVFTRSKVFQKIPIDPNIFFYCDEICYSARLFTHGVDMYQPDEIVVYHQWDRNATKRGQAYYGLKDPRNQRSKKRALHLLGIAATDDKDALQDLAKYGLGSKRPLSAYMEFLGVDLKQHTVSKHAAIGKWPAPPPVGVKGTPKLPEKKPAKRGGLFSKRPTIFVQIASYRDSECQWTVKDLFEKAAHPERIFVGIMWQYDEEEDKDCFVEPSPRPKQTRILRVKASEAQGLCWARHYAQTLYKDEDYMLQIDSHMRFTEGWDEMMINELARCPSRKPVITQYPPPYEQPNVIPENPKLSVLLTKPFDAEGNIRGTSLVLETVPDAPLRGAFVAGGYVFARAEIMIEVPYDPYMYFNQDEIALSLRYFTKGWDVYHPTMVAIYHLYKRAGDEKTKKLLHWSNDKTWRRLHDRAHKRFQHMIGTAISTDPDVLLEIDHYGLGTQRTVADFEAFVGVDFAKRIASERSIKGHFIHDIEIWKNLPQAPKPEAQPVQQASRAVAAESGALKAAPVASSGALPPVPKATVVRDKLTPLGLGNGIPPFILPDSEGKPREIQNYGGKRTAIFLLPVDFPDYLDLFFSYYNERKERFDKTDCQPVFIIMGTQEDAARVKEKYKITRSVWHDEKGALHAALGLEHGRMQPMNVIINANQRITGMFMDRNGANNLGDFLRTLEAQPVSNKSFLMTEIHPPVLMVPEVIPASMRAELIDYWRTGKQYQGTVGVGENTKVKLEGKRRVDTDIHDKGLLARIDNQMAKTVLPELRKVGAFEAMYRDLYKIGRYHADDAGYYTQHRDTGVKELAHRRYSLSIALTDDYDGGTLHFPEYSGMHYKMNAGSAILFPSALLHGVTPVTRGERYVMVSFLHGPLEEAYRKRRIQEEGKEYTDVRVSSLVEPRYPDLPYSPALYTSSIITRVIDEDG